MPTSGELTSGSWLVEVYSCSEVEVETGCDVISVS